MIIIFHVMTYACQKLPEVKFKRAKSLFCLTKKNKKNKNRHPTHTHMHKYTLYLAVWECVSQNNSYMALRKSMKEKRMKCTIGAVHNKEGINRVMISAALSHQVLTLHPCSATAHERAFSCNYLSRLAVYANNKRLIKRKRKTGDRSSSFQL